MEMIQGAATMGWVMMRSRVVMGDWRIWLRKGKRGEGGNRGRWEFHFSAGGVSRRFGALVSSSQFGKGWLAGWLVGAQ
jgi:hypothetical protein